MQPECSAVTWWAEYHHLKTKSLSSGFYRDKSVKSDFTDVFFLLLFWDANLKNKDSLICKWNIGIFNASKGHLFCCSCRHFSVATVCRLTKCHVHFGIPGFLPVSRGNTARLVRSSLVCKWILKPLDFFSFRDVVLVMCRCQLIFSANFQSYNSRMCYRKLSEESVLHTIYISSTLELCVFFQMYLHLCFCMTDKFDHICYFANGVRMLSDLQILGNEKWCTAVQVCGPVNILS